MLNTEEATLVAAAKEMRNIKFAIRSTSRVYLSYFVSPNPLAQVVDL